MYKLALAATLFAATAAHAEVQDLSSWNTKGSVTTGSETVLTTAGSNFSTKFAGGTNGSVLFDTQSFDAGTTVSFNWLFNTSDYIETSSSQPNGIWNDFAEFIIDGEVFKLADVASVGSYGSSGWQTFSYTFTQDSFSTLKFLVSNYGDQVLNSSLTISNLNVAAVPEPETYALMATGLLGLLAARRRKQKAA